MDEDGVVQEDRAVHEDGAPPLRTRWMLPLVAVGALVLFAAMQLAALVTPLNMDDEGTAEIAGMMAGYGGISLWVWWACRRSRVRFARLAPPLPQSHRWLPLAGLLLVTMLFSYGSWVVFATGVSSFAPEVVEWLVSALETVPDPSLGYRLAMAVVVVAVAPLVEEVLFRGVLLNRWAAKWGNGAALVLTSVAFGIMHANPVGIGVVGLVVALVYLRTGSLLVPIAMHAANNLIATVADLMLSDPGPMDAAAEVAALPDELPLGLVMVAVSAPVLVVFVRRNWPARGSPIPYERAAGREGHFGDE